MTKYHCTGSCKGHTDEEERTCGGENCEKRGQPLTECDCKTEDSGSDAGDE